MKKLILLALLGLAFIGTARAERRAIDWDKVSITTVTASSANFLCQSDASLFWGYIISSNTASINYFIARDTDSISAHPDTVGGLGGDYNTNQEIFSVYVGTDTFPNSGPVSTSRPVTHVKFFDTPILFSQGIAVKFEFNDGRKATFITEKLR